MNLFSIIGIGLVATLLSVLIKQTRPEMAFVVSLSTGILIFFFILDEISTLISWWQELGAAYGSLNSYLSPLIKILGIAYLTQFATQACRDAGESAIASKLELSGKIVILGLSVPIMKMVLELIQNLLS